MDKINNLKMFQKGSSGNVKGKPKGTKSRATVLRKLIYMKAMVENPNGEGALMKGTVEEQIAVALIRKALAGDIAAFREIMDSVYGKIPQPVENPVDPGKVGQGQSIPFTIMNPTTGIVEAFDIGGA
jgi:hypothetical protein